MSFEVGKYNIKAVSKMLGIQPGTLRAWERRYKMIAPKRNEAGHRLYTENHIKVLRWLIAKVDQGLTISQAVSLLVENEETIGLNNDEHSIATYNQLCELKTNLLNSLLRFNEGKAQEILNQAFSLYSIEKVLVDVVKPISNELDILLGEQKITTAHQHFVTAYLRLKVGAILQTLPIPLDDFLQEKIITVSGPGETNELGLLILSLILRRKGFKLFYLGGSVAGDDLEAIIEEIKPKFLIMSCTMKQNIHSIKTLIDILESKYDDVRIGIYFNAVDTILDQDIDNYQKNMIGFTKQEWEKWLVR